MHMRILALAMTLILPATVLAQDEEMGVPDEEMGDYEGESTGGEVSLSGDDVGSGGGSAGNADKPISLGLLLGYGISLEDGPNPWSLGFGARGGYNIDQIFLGARFVYYIGESQSINTGFGTIDIDINFWELGIEGGYDLAVGDGVVVRPELGLGLVGNGSTEFYVAPGASLLFDITDSIFIGADARLQLVMTDPLYKGLILLANGGIRL